MNELVIKSVKTYDKIINDDNKVFAIEEFVEFSRKNREVTHFCQEELCFILSSSNIDEFSKTMRIIFAHFTYQWEEMVKFFTKTLKQTYIDTTAEIMTNVNKTRQFKRNSMKLEDIVNSVISTDCSNVVDTDHAMKTLSKLNIKDDTKRNIENFAKRISIAGGAQALMNRNKGGRRPIMKNSPPKLVRNQNDQDFEKAMLDEDEGLRAQIVGARESEIKEKVDKILALMDDKDFFDKYDPTNEDPLVVIALNTVVHDDMIKDAKSNIDQLNKYLSNCQVNLEDTGNSDLLGQLQMLSKTMHSNRLKPEDLNNHTSQIDENDELTQEDVDHTIMSVKTNVQNMLQNKTRDLVLTTQHKYDSVKRQLNISVGVSTDQTSKSIHDLEATVTVSVQKKLAALYDEEIRIQKDRNINLKVENSELNSKYTTQDTFVKDMEQKYNDSKLELDGVKRQLAQSDISHKQQIRDANFELDRAEQKVKRQQADLSKMESNKGAQSSTKNSKEKETILDETTKDIFKCFSHHYKTVIGKISEFVNTSNSRMKEAMGLKFKIIKLKKKIDILKELLKDAGEQAPNAIEVQKLNRKGSIISNINTKKWGDAGNFEPLSFAGIQNDEVRNFKTSLKSFNLDESVFEKLNFEKPSVIVKEVMKEKTSDDFMRDNYREKKELMTKYESKLRLFEKKHGGNPAEEFTELDRQTSGGMSPTLGQLKSNELNVPGQGSNIKAKFGGIKPARRHSMANMVQSKIRRSITVTDKIGFGLTSQISEFDTPKKGRSMHNSMDKSDEKKHKSELSESKSSEEEEEDQQKNSGFMPPSLLLQTATPDLLNNEQILTGPLAVILEDGSLDLGEQPGQLSPMYPKILTTESSIKSGMNHNSPKKKNSSRNRIPSPKPIEKFSIGKSKKEIMPKPSIKVIEPVLNQSSTKSLIKQGTSNKVIPEQNVSKKPKMVNNQSQTDPIPLGQGLNKDDKVYVKLKERDSNASFEKRPGASVQVKPTSNLRKNEIAVTVSSKKQEHIKVANDNQSALGSDTKHQLNSSGPNKSITSHKNKSSKDLEIEKPHGKSKFGQVSKFAEGSKQVSQKSITSIPEKKKPKSSRQNHLQQAIKSVSPEKSFEFNPSELFQTSDINQFSKNIKAREKKVFENMVSQSNKKILDFNSIINLPEDRRELLYKLVEAFTQVSNEEAQKELENLLSLIFANFKKKGGNFLNNDFVSFLLSEKCDMSESNRKFMFAFGNSKNFKIKGSKEQSCIGKARSKYEDARSNDFGVEKTDIDTDTDDKIVSSLKFTNDLIMGKNQQALKHILSEGTFDTDKNHNHSTYTNNSVSKIKQYINQGHEGEKPSNLELARQKRGLDLNSTKFLKEKPTTNPYSCGLLGLNINRDMLINNVTSFNRARNNENSKVYSKMLAKEKHHKYLMGKTLPSKNNMTMSSDGNFANFGMVPNNNKTFYEKNNDQKNLMSKTTTQGNHIIKGKHNRTVSDVAFCKTMNKFDLAKNQLNLTYIKKPNHHTDKDPESSQIPVNRDTNQNDSMESSKCATQDEIQSSETNPFDNVYEQFGETQNSKFLEDKIISLKKSKSGHIEKRLVSPGNTNPTIKDSQNPFYHENFKENDFYQNLYACFMTTKLKANRIAAKIDLSQAVEIDPNDSNFKAFITLVEQFVEKHLKCGRSCKHLFGFYQKIELIPQLNKNCNRVVDGKGIADNVCVSLPKLMLEPGHSEKKKHGAEEMGKFSYKIVNPG